MFTTVNNGWMDGSKKIPWLVQAGYAKTAYL